MNARAILVALCLAVAVSCALAIKPARNETREALFASQLDSLRQRVALKSAPKVQPMANAFCELCIEEGVGEINVLLNEILNNGIIYDCGELCGTYLKNKYEQDLCDAMCDGVGIYEFIELLMNTDLDAILIYGCEEVDACPIDDCSGTCMQSLKLTAKPNPTPLGSEVHLAWTLNITQAWTGTGVLRLDISGPDGFSDGDDSLIAGGIGPVGVGTLNFAYKTTKGGKDGMSPGTYQAILTICNGDCDPSGKIPHNQQLAQAAVNFKVSN